MTKTMKNKNVNISFSDIFRTRSFQFHLQRWVIFFAVFVISFLTLWDYDFFGDKIISKLVTTWPSLAWKFFLLVSMYATARPIAKYIAESFNKNIYAWIATLAFVGYAVCIQVFANSENIENINSIKLVHLAWMLPTIAVPIVINFISIFLTRKVSPLQMKKMILRFLTSIAMSPLLIFSTLVFYWMEIEGRSFDMSDWRFELMISLIAIGILFTGLFTVYSWRKFRKIKFNIHSVSVPLIVILPIFASVLVWMIKGTFSVDWNMSPEMWYIVAVAIVIPLLIVFTLFFAKEVKFAKIMNAIFSTVLMMIWIGAFAYINYFGLVSQSYVVVDVAAAGSLVVFVLMAIYDKATKMGPVQETIFTLMIVTMILLIIFFTVVGNAKLFDAIAVFGPVDIKSLVPVLFIAMPGIYFIIAVGRVLFAQSRITHAVRIQKNINKKLAKAEKLAKGDKHE